MKFKKLKRSKNTWTDEVDEANLISFLNLTPKFDT